MLASLAGSYIPFLPPGASKEQRAADPRRTIGERYTGFEDYESKFKEYCGRLVKERYLLAEDAERLQRDLKRRWKAAVGEAP
jgi:hypothetical protein